MKLLLSLAFFLTTAFYQVFAQSTLSIDLTDNISPSADLIKDQEVLPIDEVIELAKNGEDISFFDPAASDIWSAPNNKEELSLFPELRIKEEKDEVQFVSIVGSSSISTRLRFLGTFINQDNVKENVVLMVGRQAHNVLLRSALAQKLGFYSTPVKHLKNVTINFKANSLKEEFLETLKRQTGADPKRWIIYNSGTDEKEIKIIMQDVVAIAPDNAIYNIVIGNLSATNIRGRRVLNSLSIPWSLIEIPESVNMLKWDFGRLIGNFLQVTLEDAEHFSTTLSDAKWVSRLIAKLSRKDWEEIVNYAKYPLEVKLLVVEKLIMRRNSLLNSLFGEGVFDELYVTTNISYKDFLKDGKILKQSWEGYAESFSAGDPKSPLSSKEIKSYFKSLVTSNTLNHLVKKFNELIPSTDVASKLKEKQLELAKDRFYKFLKTGEMEKTTLDVIAIPTLSGKIIASRDVVAGSYMGTDNLVQLADSVGISLDAGAYLAVTGLKAPWSANGNIRASISRRYTHLKPIKSIEASLKTPYKNILIPWLQKDYAKIFDKVIAFKKTEENQEELQKLLKQTSDTFLEELAIGESILITDSIGAGLDAQVNYSFDEILRAYIGFSANQVIIKRLHILRKDANTLHIYDDNGNLETFSLSYGIKGKIPLFNCTIKNLSGNAHLDFYKINLDPNLTTNPNIISNFIAIHSLFLDNSLELIKTDSKPFILTHSIRGQTIDFSFLSFRSHHRNMYDQFKVTTPNNLSRDFFRHSQGIRKGNNYQALALDILNSTLKDQGNEFSLSSVTGDNPADSFFGNSVTRQLIFDGEIKNQKELSSPFVNISYSWKGWKASVNTIKNYIEDLNKRYNFTFYTPLVLDNTTNIQLYALTLDFYIYQKGIDHLVNISPYAVHTIFKHYAKFYVHHSQKIEDRRDELVARFVDLQKQYLYSKNKGNFKETSKYGLQLISMIENLFNIDGMFELLGGKKNMYIVSRLNGFRENSELGDTQIISNAIGEIGSAQALGPIVDVQRFTQMTDAEFFITWLVGRI